ncbi:DUF3899 domain-containing protein [Planococcus lenghuensis]|uniref:DUF3899 domain-containing protein n=1 Tax=Planococcus lenghuensis TaxID=2213202 RepID=A0A1Q2L0E7_9BACL|nr:DUF3899 domain-containing protein [Planococcus lenghuensis]AQQ53919.1 hypothetical protein B0X71_12995 [Planococcus lenghuensis]
MKKFLLSALAVQAIILLTILFREQQLSLLSYIDTSFIYGGILFFIGATIYVVQSGFFDIFTVSMRKAFDLRSGFDIDEMRTPSELIAVPFLPLLSVGTATITLMGVALFSYYI